MEKYNGIIKSFCLLVLLPIIIWLFALKGTCHLYIENRDIANLSSVDSIAVIRNENIPIVSKSLLSNGEILQLLASNFADNDIRFISYTPQIIDSENNYKLYMGRLIVCSRFINLIKLISFIENAKLPLKILSINFEYNVNQKYDRNRIVMTIFLESIEV